jgi:hypothetical protein
MKLKAYNLIDLAAFYQKIFKVDQEMIELNKLKKEENQESLESTLNFLKTLILNYT